MIPRWSHIVFAGIWLTSTVVFILLVIDAYHAESIALARADRRMPPYGQQIVVGNIAYSDVINAVADAHDKNAAAMEASIRQSSRTLFVLDVISAIAAFMGFIAQVGEHLHESRNRSADADT